MPWIRTIIFGFACDLGPVELRIRPFPPPTKVELSCRAPTELKIGQTQSDGAGPTRNTMRFKIVMFGPALVLCHK